MIKNSRKKQLKLHLWLTAPKGATSVNYFCNWLADGSTTGLCDYQ